MKLEFCPDCGDKVTNVPNSAIAPPYDFCHACGSAWEWRPAKMIVDANGRMKRLAEIMQAKSKVTLAQLISLGLLKE